MTSSMTSFRSLIEEEKRTRRLFSQLQNGKSQRGSTHQYNGYQSDNQEVQGRADLYFSNNSQAETTLARYGGGSSSNTDPEAPTRAGADGRQHPYDLNDPSYLIKFPLGWRGCYKYGQSNYWKRERCPEGNNIDIWIMDQFHKELKYHKPEFRRPAYVPRVSYTAQHYVRQ